MMGVPSETLEELKATRDLWLRLVEDNPRAIIFTPNRFRPLPGTAMFDLAVAEWGYQPPRTLEQWIDIELESDYTFPWYPEGMKEFCNLLQVSSYFVDDKIFRFSTGTTPFYKALRLASSLYAPVARFRLRHGLDRFLVEYPLYRFAMSKLLQMMAGPEPIVGSLPEASSSLNARMTQAPEC
jgi:hypothetical protein